MTLSEYLQGQPYGRMKEIERETGVGYATLYRAKIGEALRNYAVAKKISEATGGVVSIPELCESTPPKEAA